MRGDPQVDLPGAVLVGRRFARGETVPPQSSADDSAAGETVTISGIILRICSDGLTVVGPKPDVVHNVLWQRVKSLEIGEDTSFEDGSPARSIQVELDDREVSFLVPVAVLTGERRRILNEIASAHLGPVGEPEPEPEQRLAQRLEPRLEPKLEPRFVVGPGSTSPARVVLPPPPPRSNVAMPPLPKDARESAGAVWGLTGGDPSTPADRSQKAVFFLPTAVPPARRVDMPGQKSRQAASMSAPRAVFTDMSEVPKVLSRLPPPPPRGSSSRLPPDPDGLSASQDMVPSEPISPVAVPSLGPASTAPAGPARRVPGQARERPSSARRDRKPRRAALFGAGLVAAVGGGALIGLSVTGHSGSATPTTLSSIGPSTRNSSGGEPGALTGPANGADPRTVAHELNIVAAGLLESWQHGHAPWSRVATAEANASLARCLGLPVSHIGALVGSRQPGGPGVYTSGWIADGAGNTGFASIVELNRDVSTEQSDIAALDKPGAASCLEGWFASLDVADDAIVGVPSVTALSISTAPGEHSAGFGVAVSTRSGSIQKNVHEEVVVLGAGRVEIGLVSESTGGILNSSLESSELTSLESRLRTVAGS